MKTQALAKAATAGFRIEYRNSQASIPCATYDEAVERVRQAWPEAVIGHDADLTDGGDLTMCWSCEEEQSKDDDDGVRACATITAVSGARAGS